MMHLIGKCAIPHGHGFLLYYHCVQHSWRHHTNPLSFPHYQLNKVGSFLLELACTATGAGHLKNNCYAEKGQRWPKRNTMVSLLYQYLKYWWKEVKLYNLWHTPIKKITSYFYTDSRKGRERVHLHVSYAIQSQVSNIMIIAWVCGLKTYIL